MVKSFAFVFSFILLPVPALANHNSGMEAGEVGLVHSFCTEEAGKYVFAGIPATAQERFTAFVERGDCVGEESVPVQLMERIGEIHSVRLEGIPHWVELWRVLLPNGQMATIIVRGELGEDL